MVQAGEHAPLVLELPLHRAAPAALHELEGDGAVQRGVPREVHLAHAAHAPSSDTIRQSPSRSPGRSSPPAAARASSSAPRPSAGVSRKSPVSDAAAQQRLDLRPQGLRRRRRPGPGKRARSVGARACASAKSSGTRVVSFGAGIRSSGRPTPAAAMRGRSPNPAARCVPSPASPRRSPGPRGRRSTAVRRSRSGAGRRGRG